MTKHLLLILNPSSRRLLLGFTLILTIFPLFSFGQTEMSKVVEKFGTPTTEAKTFTVPSSVTEITVEVWGAGGGGLTANKASAGGGGGGYAKSIIPVSPGDTFDYTVGEGGGPGVDGGDSTFNNTSITEIVGGGGLSGTGGIGGDGGVSSGGSENNSNGGKGGNAGGRKGNSDNYTTGGGGGAAGSSEGDGADGGDGNNNGGTGAEGVSGAGSGGNVDNDGGQPGGGGGGQSKDGAGGSGGDGQIRITYIERYVQTTTGDWDVANNWFDQAIPGALNNALIADGVISTVTQDQDVNALTLGADSQVNVNDGISLNIKGEVVNNSEFTGPGEVILNGTSAQTISGSGSFENLTIDNTDAVTTNITNLDVSNLNLINGSFEVASGANLTLSSLLNRTNGRLGGAGTIKLAGPTNIESGLFLNDTHQGNLILNVTNTDFSIADGFEVEGNLNLTEGNVPLGTQTLKLGGNLFKSNGIIDAIDAVIEFTGDTEQAIAPGAFVDNTISHVKNSGNGGPNLSSELNITDMIEVSSGTIQSNGYLVLKSSETKTAFVGPVGNNADITGDVTVERYIPAKRAFRFFASPVTTTTSIRENWQEGGAEIPGLGTDITGPGGSSNGFDVSGTNNPSLYKFNNIDGKYEAITNTENTTLKIGDGFFMLIRGDRTVNLFSNSTKATPTVIRTKGNLKIGTYTVEDFSDADDSAFKLIGNPYQSPVDMVKILSEQSKNLNTNFIWVWDVNISENGGFVAIDLSDGTNTVSGSVANQYLQDCQSVFIQTAQANVIQTNKADADGSIPTLNFVEDAKVPDRLNTPIYGAVSMSTIKKIRVDLFYGDQSNEDENALDGTVIKFDDRYTNSKDLTDAVKFFMQDEEIATTVEETQLSIQSRKNPEAGDKILLDISKYQKKNTNYALRLRVPAFDGLEVILKDKYTNEEVLVRPETDFAYNYTKDNEASAVSDRFEILFQNVTLGLNTEILSSDIQLYPNPNSGNFNIALPTNTGNVEVLVYSALGQKIYQDTNTDGQKQLRLNLEGLLSTGIYFVHLDIDSKTIVKKIIVN